MVEQPEVGVHERRVGAVEGDAVGRRRVEVRSDGNGLEAWADLKIAIPRGQKAAIHLGVGAVTVANVDGELLVDCAAASVEAAGTRGSLRIDTGSGGAGVSAAAGPSKTSAPSRSATARSQ